MSLQPIWRIKWKDLSCHKRERTGVTHYINVSALFKRPSKPWWCDSEPAWIIPGHLKLKQIHRILPSLSFIDLHLCFYSCDMSNCLQIKIPVRFLMPQLTALPPWNLRVSYPHELRGCKFIVHVRPEFGNITWLICVAVEADIKENANANRANVSTLL